MYINFVKTPLYESHLYFTFHRSTRWASPGKENIIKGSVLGLASVKLGGMPLQLGSCRSLKAQPGMLYRSLLPLLIGQSKSQGQSRFKGRKDCTSVWLEPHICAGREGIDGGILGVSLPQWVLYFFTQVRLLVQGHTSNK